jgi:hypothetical protein
MLKQLKQHNIDILDKLIFLLETIALPNFTRQRKIISDATVGQHVRHIVEFYQCLQKGLPNNEINYDDRCRNVMIECDLIYAIGVLNQLKLFIKSIQNEQELLLRANFSAAEDMDCIIPTSLSRELAFVLDHSVHHLAIIKIALADDGHSFAEDFGVAAATLKYRQTCAQ